MRHLANITTQILGVLLMALGIAGLFLPFLQGILFFLLGLYLFTFSTPRLRKYVYKWIEPYPRVTSACQSMDNRIKRVFGIE